MNDWASIDWKLVRRVRKTEEWVRANDADDIVKAIMELEDDVEEMQDTMGELETENAQLRGELAALQERIDQLEAERPELELENNYLRGDLAEREAELAEARQEPAIPEGYVLVPVEPTWEMLVAADSMLKNKNGVFSMTDAYKAMLAAQQEAQNDD